MFLTSLMIIFVAASGTYCLIYCVIPFICYMNELKEIQNYTKMHYVYATLFVLIFSAYPIKALGSSGALYIALYLLIAVLLIEATVHGIRRIKFRFLNNKMSSGGWKICIYFQWWFKEKYFSGYYWIWSRNKWIELKCIIGYSWLLGRNRGEKSFFWFGKLYCNIYFMIKISIKFRQMLGCW